MARKYKFYMLCRDLAKTTPFLRADGSPVITTAQNEREAWNKFKGMFEARQLSQEYVCEVELLTVRDGEDMEMPEKAAAVPDSKVELDTALEGLKNVLRDQGRLHNQNFK